MIAPLSPLPGGEDKLRDIRSITDAALSYLDADDLLVELLSRVKQILDGDTAAVLLLDPSSRQLIATAASGLEEEVRQGVRIPYGRGFAGRIAAEQRPVILNHVDHSNVLNPILLSKGIRSLIGVPLLVNGAVIGVLHVGSVRKRVFTEDDAALLQLTADRAALAVQSLRSRDDRAAAVAIQRSLLPSAPPAVAGVEIAARYVPGHGQVGGDWYDVFTLPSGELCVVIGDVAGSGLEAAIIMGRMRSALRAYALETPDPADVLARLDRKMQHFEAEAMATLLYAVLDPVAGQVRISAAGHFPPIATAPGRPAAFADIAVDVPIGVADRWQRQTTTLRLAPGETLCFFTDGLVERRAMPLDGRISRLCEAVSPGPPEDVCVSVMGALVADECVGDDIALLVLRWQPSGGEGLPGRSVALLVHHVAQLDGRVLDVGLLVPPGPALRREHPAAVHLAEVAVRVFVPGLGVLGRFVIQTEVPIRVFVPAVGLDELVLLLGRRLVLAPVVPLIQRHLALLDLVLRELERALVQLRRHTLPLPRDRSVMVIAYPGGPGQLRSL